MLLTAPWELALLVRVGSSVSPTATAVFSKWEESVVVALGNVGKKELAWERCCSGSGMSGLQSLLCHEPFHPGLLVEGTGRQVDLGDVGSVCLADPWFLRA